MDARGVGPVSEEVRQQQTAEVISYSSKPFGWFLHLKYRNNDGHVVYAQAGFGPFPDESSGVFPLWKSPLEPVMIHCPVVAGELFMDYTGDILVPIPEMVIQTMFTGLLHSPKISTIRRA